MDPKNPPATTKLQPTFTIEIHSGGVLLVKVSAKGTDEVDAGFDALEHVVEWLNQGKLTWGRRCRWCGIHVTYLHAVAAGREPA